MKQGRRLRRIAPLCLAALLAGAAAARAEELAGSEWRPVRIGTTDVSPGAKAFVQFKMAGELAGDGGCNRFFGRYKIAGDSIEIGSLGSTKMACPEPAMELEVRFLAALETARIWHRDRTTLILLDAKQHEQVRLQQTDAD